MPGKFSKHPEQMFYAVYNMILAEINLGFMEIWVETKGTKVERNDKV